MKRGERCVRYGFFEIRQTHCNKRKALFEKNHFFFKKGLHNLTDYVILNKLAYHAMKQEVAELSGNFCGELSVQETGEGILGCLL